MLRQIRSVGRDKERIEPSDQRALLAFLSNSIHTVEQILAKLREAEVAPSNGQAVAQACRTLGITEHTYDRWHNEYGGLKVDPVKRLKELERENTRVKRAVVDRTLDKLILKEAAEGNFSAQRADGRR